jgi:hypothetical protein
MNPNPESHKTSDKTTPAWLKWTLISVMFASALAGFFSNGILLKKMLSPFLTTLSKRSDASAPAFSGFSKLSNKIDSDRQKFSDATLICQGTIVRENGKSLAMINGHTATVGGTINGIRILKITSSNVLIECNGETRRLVPGERFLPIKK